MSDFQKRIKWDRGDILYYTKGTQSHTHDQENYIARELNAQPCGDFWSWDELALDVNGASVVYAHHAGRVSPGANEGNAQRNFLRNIQIEAMRDGERAPDVIYSGHVHTPVYSTYVYRLREFEYKTMHYIITPSWQLKTRYAYQAAPIVKNRIGGVYQHITAGGVIAVPRFVIMP
jgi:hypothetical protein